MTAPATRCSVIPVSPNTPTLGVGLQDRQHDDPAAVEVGVQLRQVGDPADVRRLVEQHQHRRVQPAGAPARITRSVSAATSGAADPPPSLLSRYRVCRNR
jgi:hypothetical protein